MPRGRRPGILLWCACRRRRIIRPLVNLAPPVSLGRRSIDSRRLQRLHACFDFALGGWDDVKLSHGGGKVVFFERQWSIRRGTRSLVRPLVHIAPAARLGGHGRGRSAEQVLLREALRRLKCHLRFDGRRGHLAVPLVRLPPARHPSGSSVESSGCAFSTEGVVGAHICLQRSRRLDGRRGCLLGPLVNLARITRLRGGGRTRRIEQHALQLRVICAALIG
eukprot:scaffold122832_cov30-Tisochrysis_lutea.AAC.1